MMNNKITIILYILFVINLIVSDNLTNHLGIFLADIIQF